MWWTHSQAGMTAFVGGRRRLSRDRRDVVAGTGMRRHLNPHRHHGGDLSGRIRWRHPAGQAGHVHGRHPVPACPRSWRRCSSTRCGWRRWGFPGPSFAVSLALVLVDDPGDRAGDRGDAANRSGGPPGGQLRTGRSRSGKPLPGSSFPRGCPASSPGSCSRWPG